MRRSASEIIRSLEVRVARLEAAGAWENTQKGRKASDRLERKSSSLYDNREIKTIQKIMRANAKEVYDYMEMSAEEPRDLPSVSLDKYEYAVDYDSAFSSSFEHGWQGQYMGFEEQFLDSPERYSGRFQGLRYHPNKPSKSKWVHTDSRGNDKDVSFREAKEICESWLHKTWHGQF